MKFRTLEQADIPLLHEWLQRPHVKQWWNDGDDTLEKVRLHYFSDPETTKRFLLISSTGNPIGYFQYYIAPEGIGIDQFLADESSLSKGLGSEAIRSFIAVIREEHDPEVLITDPSPENKRAIRCYEKVGFQHTKTVGDLKGKMVYLMEINNR